MAAGRHCTIFYELCLIYTLLAREHEMDFLPKYAVRYTSRFKALHVFGSIGHVA